MTLSVAHISHTSESDTISFLGFIYLKGRRFSWAHLLALAVVDRMMLPFLGREKRATCPRIHGKTIAVSKVDLLGDVLMISPVLAEIRKQAPTCKICLVIGSWSSGAGRLMLEEGLCDDIIYYDPFLMNPAAFSRIRKIKQWLGSLTQAIAAIKKHRVGIYLDLRSFSPNSLLLARAAGVPHKIGFGLRGFSYLLQQEIPYRATDIMGQSYLDALPLMNLKSVEYTKPILRWNSSSNPLPPALRLPDNYVVIHPFSRDARKLVHPDLWRKVIALLPGFVCPVIIGTREDSENHALMDVFAQSRSIALVGQTSFSEAANCIEHSRGFLGVDSVFSHVALGFDRPALILARSGSSCREAFPRTSRKLEFVELDELPEKASFRLIVEFMEMIEHRDIPVISSPGTKIA